MPPNRLIDRTERTRKLPMRILVLGLCRTGTTTLTTALRKLSYTPHHMRSVLAHPQEIALWEEAIASTLTPSSPRAPYGRQEFDILLADYDAVTDIPGAIFAKQLIEAYPEAKVILTTRRYEDWERSMRGSIWCLDRWWLFVGCRVVGITQMAPLVRLVHDVFEVHNGNQYGGLVARRAFERHCETVRGLVPKERLLEVAVEDEGFGWEALCGFLGEEVPAEEFPRFSEDEEGAMRRSLERAWWGMVRYLALMVVLPGLVTVGAVLVYFYIGDIRQARDRLILEPLREYLSGTL